MAAEGGDPSEVIDAHQRLIEFLSDQPGRRADVRAARAALTEWNRRHGWMHATLTPAATGEVDERRPQGLDPAVRQPTVGRTKVGRNDPCPCGSGRKYKRCCGAGA